MKKTIFILTLLLPFGLLCAQSTIIDLGNENDVDVEQVGLDNHSHVYTDGDYNAPSFVHQRGDGTNNSDVDQLADGNKAEVDQTNDYLLDVNQANVYQTGNWNTATVTQVAWGGGVLPVMTGRTANVNQAGDYNRATVTQDGKNLEAWVIQPGNRNRANVDQYGIGSYANVEQVGDRNRARVRQEGIRQDADINQWGNGGRARQIQGVGIYKDIPGPNVGNEAQIDQTVNSRRARASQFQEGRYNDAYIYQDAGRRNIAYQVQINELHTPPLQEVNDADIYQGGGGMNKAFQLQDYSVPGADPNTAYVEQNGRFNYSHEIQIGGGNESEVYQTGNGNTSTVYQNKHYAPDPSVASLPYWVNFAF